MMGFAGLGTGGDWRQALAQALGSCPKEDVDLVLSFVSSHHRDAYPEMLGALAESLHPRTVFGCSGQGVIGIGAELEEEPAVSVLAMSLPGASLRAMHLSQSDLEAVKGSDDMRYLTGIQATEVHAWVVLADPFTFDTDRLVTVLSDAYPGVPLVGGMASARPGVRGTSLFLNREVHSSGALLLAVGGSWTVCSVVSQGAEPIGQTWTVTGVEGNVIRSLGGRRPLDVLVETMKALPTAIQQRASRNLLVGLAMDEYRDEYGRGDFLIRNLVGVDQESGAFAVGASPRVGQTLQFQVRDARAADDELRVMLRTAREAIGDARPSGALLCSCNGRGVGLFGEPHHDASALAREFGGLAAAGLFCNGELGPVGGKNFVHGFTASIAFFVPFG